MLFYPIIYLLLGYWISKQKRVHFYVLVLMLLSLTSLMSYYPTTTKEEWEKTATYVNPNENDLLLFCDSGIKYSFKYYYDGETKMIGLKSSVFAQENQAFLDSIQSELDEAEDIYLITSHCKKTKGFYEGVFEMKYILENEKQYKGVHIYQYKGD